MRLRETKVIFGITATLLIIGLNAPLVTAQNNPPPPSPSHVFNRAASGQTSRATTEISPTEGQVPQPKSVTQQSPPPAINFGMAPSGTLTYVCDPNVDATAPGTCNFLNTTIAGIYAASFTNVNARIYIQFGITGLGSSTSGVPKSCFLQ